MDNRINTNLIEANTKLVDEIKILKEDKEILQRRIDKSIEYISCHFKEMVADEEAQVLLEILKGEYIYE